MEFHWTGKHHGMSQQLQYKREEVMEIMGVGEILVCLVCLSQFSYSVKAYDLMNNLLRVQKKRKGCPSYEGYGLFSKYSFPPGKGEKPCSSQGNAYENQGSHFCKIAGSCTNPHNSVLAFLVPL